MMGDIYVMPPDRFAALHAKWQSFKKCPKSSIVPLQQQYPNGLGTLARRGIDVVSFGLAKPLAMTIARIMGAQNCGCDAREQRLNELVPDVADVGVMDWIKLTPKI
ncbi:MAG: hypothetical protein FWD61_19835, partial [Phycisphaerales bacterium]|nr:hypothetical protein [Phycisphaerales bacterium]